MMRRSDAVGLVAVLAVLAGLFSETLVRAASPAREPVQVVKSGTIVTLYDVVFLDEKRGWIAGADGTILSTEDSGASWQDRPTGSKAHLYAVLFLNEKDGWAAGALGTLLVTKDGGRTWTVRESGTPSTFFDIAFPDPTIGWIAGNSGALLTTLDGVENW